MIEIKNIGEYLKSNKIMPSVQRIKIFNYLYTEMNHPTVEKIYKELIDEIPSLSKTTVYNTLKQFVKKGIVQIINIEDNKTRYDADTSTHGHFKCMRCGMLYDFAFDNSNIEISGIENFDIHQTHLYIKGICSKCKN